mmetsp:Transcript_2075/g.6189  ORF Transcript_2075/g.6189 Transcript_2075/m.6189 type:complete len:378 (+) Transcript_2075:185-1318(+)
MFLSPVNVGQKRGLSAGLKSESSLWSCARCSRSRVRPIRLSLQNPLFARPLYRTLFGTVSIENGAAVATKAGVGFLWLRIGAILCQLFGIYYVGGALWQMKGFVISTIVGRVYLCIAFLALWALHPPCPLLIPCLGSLNMFSALLTLKTMKDDKANDFKDMKTSSESSTSSLNDRSEREVHLENFSEAWRHQIGGQNISPRTVELSRDGRQVVVSLADSRVLVIEMVTGEIMHTFKNKGSDVLAAGYCDEGGVWISSVDRESRAPFAELYDDKNFTLIRKISYSSSEAFSVEFAPDSKLHLVKRRVAGSMAVELRRENGAELNSTIWRKKVGKDGIISTRVRWSEDRQYLIAGGGASSSKACVHVWRGGTGPGGFFS